MMGALLHHAGRDPSFLVGGVTRDFDSNFRLGEGPHFVVEGDEYDTAYFDKGPKFLHYRPRTAIFTSCELDHADIYRDEAHYESAFEKFADLLPADGFLAACASYDSVVRIARRSRAPVETYAVDRPGRRLGGARPHASPRTAPASRSSARARRSPTSTCRSAGRTTSRTRSASPPPRRRSASRPARSRRGSPPSAA